MAEPNGDAPAQTNGHTSSPTSQPVPAVAAAATGATTTSGPLPVLNPTVPLTSTQDNGTAKRPRDARLIYMLLTSLGLTAYQERVPLQLLDFAYRHTSSILSDALHLSSDAYVSQQTRARDPPGGSSFKDADGQVSMSAVQLAIQSRLQYQFSAGNAGGLSKEFLLETAEARNKVALPRLAMNEWGVRLPNEKFVLTGVPWGLKEEWESESADGDGGGGGGAEADVDMVISGGVEEGREGDEEGGTADDLFGDLEDDIMEMEDS